VDKQPPVSIILGGNMSVQNEDDSLATFERMLVGRSRGLWPLRSLDLKSRAFICGVANLKENVCRKKFQG
jgi:hypothetical protein